MEIGKKYDNGKPNYVNMLVGFPFGLNQVANLYEFGANKYGLENWKLVQNGKIRYLNALLRHTFAHCRGELKDPESGLPHLCHAAWNCLALLQLHENDYAE